MKKKLLVFSAFIMMALTVAGCGDNKKDTDNKQKGNESITSNEPINDNKENLELNESLKKLYDMIDTYFIPDIYPNFESYEDNNFYMDKVVKYENLSDQSRLYYAYKTIENVERRWFTSCDELKGYSYLKEDIATTCTKSAGEIIAKDQSSEEWFFNNVNKESLEKAYHDMYGDDKPLPLKDFTMSVTGTCVYSKIKDDFLCFEQTGGDTYPDHGERKLERYEEKEDYIEFYDRYLWIKMGVDGDTYYKSRLNEKEKIDSTNKDFSKGALYKHTFKKDNQGNYYWYSSERVE